jgi:hypothetical protein
MTTRNQAKKVLADLAEIEPRQRAAQKLFETALDLSAGSTTGAVMCVIDALVFACADAPDPGKAIKDIALGLLRHPFVTKQGAPS